MNENDTVINTLEALEQIYGLPGETSTIKETQHLIPQYRAFIEASPFCLLATCGPEGLDCSPRGDKTGFVKTVDDQTLHLPDRRGNNRIDSLRNIVRDPRVALCCLIPGSRNALRINGLAHISVDPKILNDFSVEGKEPRSVIVIKTQAVYFQCGRAIVRSRLWDEETKIDPNSLPTPGDVLATLSNERVGGKSYDEEWESRAQKTLW